MSSGTENRQRTEQFNVRLTPEEAERLRADARREGVTPATILRKRWAPDEDEIGWQLVSASLSNVLALLMTDKEMEYTLYRHRSTNKDPERYATLALSASTSALTKVEYDILRTCLENVEETRESEEA